MCQGVNHTWRDTVVGSVKLQRFLFLSPEQDSGVVALVDNPPERSRRPHALLSKYVLRDNPEADSYETHCQPVVPNPILFFNTDFFNRGCSLKVSKSSYADLLSHKRIPFHNIDLLVGLFNGSRSDSGCLEMFLTQPPVREVTVELNMHKCNDVQCRDRVGQCGCRYELSGVRNPKGLRVKDVFAAARSFHCGYPSLFCDEEDVISISIAFEPHGTGSRKGVLLLSAEDMRLAKAEALGPRPELSI